MAGQPAFRKYDANGELVYERASRAARSIRWSRRFPIAGRGAAPASCRWWRRRFGPRPSIDPAGSGSRSCVPYTYVYDAGGEKIRTVQFRGAGIISPSSLWFNAKGPAAGHAGCYEFAAEVDADQDAYLVKSISFIYGFCAVLGKRPAFTVLHGDRCSRWRRRAAVPTAPTPPPPPPPPVAEAPSLSCEEACRARHD